MDGSASPEERLLALAAAQLCSHRAAAWGWRMTPYEQKPEITTTDGRRTRVRAVRAHRSAPALLLPPMIAGPKGEYRLDFPWPDILLVAEVHGWQYHSSFAAFHDGMTRQNVLTLDGYAFLNYSWKHVTRSPATVVRELTATFWKRMGLFGQFGLPGNRDWPKRCVS